MNKTASHPRRRPSPSKIRKGVVERCLVGTLAKAAPKVSSAELIQAVHDGLPVEELEVLQASYQMPWEHLMPRLGLSKATLHRRKREGRLRPEESDRVVRYARLLGRAIEVMGDRDTARRWLTSPQAGLGGEVPLDYAQTEVGAREVEDLLGRIEHGVYS
ncbi:MAG: DUF2384 domain-containing protein [Verrucomicrobia bacterium]|nr:MAG: DUF2384 domain-containing protein [Verrucomicrobiota bacterium]